MRFRSKDHNWSRLIRWLHFALVLTIGLQLFSSQLMASPNSINPGRIGRSFMVLHEYDGLVALGVIFLHWVLLIVDKETLLHLFPWNHDGIASIKMDMRLLLRGRFLEIDHSGGLPGFVHGLGLLAATGMGLTGLVIFGSWQLPGFSTLIKMFFLEIHSYIAVLIWCYVGGHLVMALLHEISGQSVMRRIFRF